MCAKISNCDILKITVFDNYVHSIYTSLVSCTELFIQICMYVV